MQKFFDNVFDRNGSVIAGAVVTVSDAATGALSTIYSSNSLGIKANPITCDSNGYFEFYAANGRYTLAITGAGLQTRHVTDVLLEDIIGQGSDSIGFLQAGTGAVSRSSQDKLREFLTPDDFGARSADDSAVIAKALTESVSRGCTMRFASGTYNVSSPIALTQGMRVEIPGGVTIKANPGFVGAAVFVLGTTTTYNEYMMVEGRGTVDADNKCNYAIDIRQGSRCRITRLNLHNGILGGLKIGTEGATNASVENDSLDLHIEQAVLVQNDTNSLGLAYENATDCYASKIIVRGYRVGVRTSSTSASIDMSQVHVWGWSTNGAMTRGFDLQGQASLVQCYADTPFDVIGLGGDLYGFYLHAFACQLTSCKVFMNTSMGTVAGQVDIGTTGRLVLVAADRETFSRIHGIVGAGANTSTNKFKQMFGSVGGSGFFDSTYRDGILDGGPSTFTSVTDREVNWPSQTALHVRATSTYEGNVTRSGAAATGRDVIMATSGTARIIFRLTSDAEAGANAGSNLQILRRDDAGAALGTPIHINRATGRVSFNDGDIQVRGTWDFPFYMGAFALWANATSGKLYIKNTSGGVPASDTDGTVVGTQT